MNEKYKKIDFHIRGITPLVMSGVNSSRYAGMFYKMFGVDVFDYGFHYDKGNEMHKKLDFHIRGVAPLIQHNVQLANPRNHYVQEMKKLTAKRTKKTEEDIIELSHLEFLGGLYLGADLGVIVPGEHIEALIGGAARKVKKGKDVKAGILSDAGANGGWKLIYKGPTDAEELWNDQRFVDVRAVKVGQATIMRTRPIFHEWELKFSVHYLPDVISGPDEIRDWIETAGRVVGLMEFRPRYGRFEIVG